MLMCLLSGMQAGGADLGKCLTGIFAVLRSSRSEPPAADGKTFSIDWCELSMDCCMVVERSCL